MQRKTADDMLKMESKNMVNSVPQTAPMQNTPSPNLAMGGMGGPNPMGGMDSELSEESSPFFIGDHSVVRITNPNNPNASTIWLVDAKKKVLRPFMSDQAFQNAFENPADAEKSITTISVKELGPGGSLNGFKPLGKDKGIRDDGSMDDIDFSEAQIQKRYGKQVDPQAENKALSMLDGLMGKLHNPA